VPPEGLTEVIVNRSSGPGRRFLDIANDGELREEEPTGMAMGSPIVVKEGHLSHEEELEKKKGVLMRRVRMLRAECEMLEQQVEQARSMRTNHVDAQEKVLGNVDSMMYVHLHALIKSITFTIK
jgi:hypothetical protein